MKKKGVIYQIIGSNVFLRFEDNITITLPKQFFSDNISIGTIIILNIKEDKITNLIKQFLPKKLKENENY